MQTFTIFFGFAVIAIAIENFTANFHLVKSNDAGAKVYQENQSRGGKPVNGFRYWLRGNTGKEIVKIRDGNKTDTKPLTKENQPFVATNPIVTIEYTNDKCCEPEDQNVIFTPGYPYRLSTKDNNNDYFGNWNCSACAASHSPKMRNQMDLQSRARPKPDKCYQTRKDDATDCLKCSLVSNGQFCYPGNYTIEFETEGQCYDVTFGECDIPPEHIYGHDDQLRNETGQTARSKCNVQCQARQRCKYYRWNSQTQDCIFIDDRYKAQFCNIWAAPAGKSASECLVVEKQHECDTMVKEDCEYSGEELYRYPQGEITSADVCKDNCDIKGDECKYWIFKKSENECILKKDGKKTCRVWSGIKMSLNDYDYCQGEFYKAQM